MQSNLLVSRPYSWKSRLSNSSTITRLFAFSAIDPIIRCLAVVRFLVISPVKHFGTSDGFLTVSMGSCSRFDINTILSDRTSTSWSSCEAPSP